MNVRIAPALLFLFFGCKEAAAPAEAPAEAEAPKPATPAPAKTGAAALLAADTWLCDGGPEKSWITAATTRAELVKLVGEANVTDEEENYMESEETFVVTAVYPNDRDKRATIHWKDQDATKGIARLDLSGSRWTTSQGLRPGTTLEEAEKIHGGPFELMGFEWDMSGMAVVDTVGVTFGVRGDNVKRPEYDKVVGDGEFKSNDANMRAVQPVITSVVCEPK